MIKKEHSQSNRTMSDAVSIFCYGIHTKFGFDVLFGSSEDVEKVLKINHLVPEDRKLLK